MNHPTFEQFKTASLAEQTEIFDLLFEHTESLIKYTLGDKENVFTLAQINNYQNMVEEVRSRLLSLTKQNIETKKKDLSNIIEAHPKLGVPKEIQGELSEMSKMEQKNLAANENTPEIKQALLDLNNEYENKYPGLRFVCFVNGRNRMQIIEEMKAIISSENSWTEECDRAINAMCDIALDRVKKLDL